MNENVSDADLERFLRRRDPIAREYATLGDEQPPAALDALVLEHARAALNEEGAAASWRRRRWPAITALAATVVLSFTLIAKITLDGHYAALTPSVTSPDVASPPAAAAPGVAPAPQTPVPMQDLELKKAETGAPVRGESHNAYASPPRSPASVGAAAPARMETRAAEGLTAKTARRDGQRLLLEADQSRSQSVADDAVANAKGDAGTMAASASSVEQENYVAVSGDRSAAPASAAAKSSADARARAGEAQQGAPALHNASNRPPVPARAIAQFARQPAAASGLATTAAPEAVDESADPRDPVLWLRQIQALRAAGRHEEARRELEAFRVAYPQIREVYEVEDARLREVAPGPPPGTPTK